MLTVFVATDVRLRGERRKDQICSEIQYQKTFERLSQLPHTVEHLVVQLGTLILNTLAVVVVTERLSQEFLSRIPGWFSWRVRSTQSSTLWSTSAGGEFLAFLDSSTSSTLRQNYWMIW